MQLRRAGKRFFSVFIVTIMFLSLLQIYDSPFALDKAAAQMSILQQTEANIVWVTPGSYHYTALDDEGRVYTWADGSAYGLEGTLGRAYTTGVTGNAMIGVQVTTTIESGVELPFIIQISSSYRNSYALDRDGNIWSWGYTGGGAYNDALGRGGAANLPGKVEMPTDPNDPTKTVKAVWIGAGYFGCKFIDTYGDLWVFGWGTQNSLGTGSLTNQNRPVRLTTSEGGTEGDLLGLNFKMVESSDFYDTACALAITADGRLYTWGRTTNALGYLGTAQPQYIGTYNTGTIGSEVKSLTCGNGAMGFLTYSGDVYTWGTNNNIEGPGRLGLGTTAAIVTTPTKITQVIIDGTTPVPAPKFVSLSIYAWSSSAVDENGVIYGAGANHGNKHASISWTTTYLQAYTPIPFSGSWTPRVFVVSEGYYGTQWIDVYGNCYSYGIGGFSGGGTFAEPWVHFLGLGVPMFTALDSTPSVEQKRYTTSPKATLSVKLNRAADEVKYVILYPDDLDTYSADGESFYQKSFYEFEAPYYNANTDPQLLLSPNYDKPESRYYANPKISQNVFDEIYAIKFAGGTGEAGTMDSITVNSFQKTNLLDGNCIVWVQSKNSVGTTRMIYQVANFYTQANVWVQGILPGAGPNGTDKLLYSGLVQDVYGMPLTRDGSKMAYPEGPGNNPPLGWDVVQPYPSTTWAGSNFYKLVDGQLAVESTPDEFGVYHRTYSDAYGSREVILDKFSKFVTSPTNETTVTFVYEKDPDKWADVTLHFVYEDGASIPELVTYIENLMVPIFPGQLSLLNPYTPPNTNDPNDAAIGYYIGTYTGTETIELCTFPDEFNPILNSPAATHIYIIYKKGLLLVHEEYLSVTNDGATKTNIANNEGLISIKNPFEPTDTPTRNGPNINNYVLFGYELWKDVTYNMDGTFASGTLDGSVTFDWLSPDPLVSGHYDKIPAEIADLDDKNWAIKWLYYPDLNNDGVPDEYAATVTIHWLGRNSDGSTSTLKAFTVVDLHETEKSFVENKATHIANPDKWLFSYPNTYTPAGNDSPTELIKFDKDTVQHVYFWYRADFNENDIPDEDEYITIKYRKYADYTTPLQPDDDVTFLLGDVYILAPPTISGYFAVGWVAGEYDSTLSDSEIHLIDSIDAYLTVYFETDALGGNGQVLTFIYKEIAQPITINFISETYMGTQTVMPPQVLNGLVGQDVTLLVSDQLAGHPAWILDTIRSTLPVSGEYILSNVAQTYTLFYTENLEHSIITVGIKSTNDKLDFQYTLKMKPNESATTVTAPDLPNYEVIGWTLYDRYDTYVASGTGDTHLIDPADGHQTLVFTYVCLDTEVYVRCIGSDGKLIHSYYLENARIGEKYAVTAPHLDPYVLDDELVKIIDPVIEGANIIEFQYAEPANIVFALYETGKTEPIRKINIPNTLTSYTANDLETMLGNLYTFNQTETTQQGGESLPFDIIDTIINYGGEFSFYFDKILVPVVIRFVDTANNQIAPDILTHADSADPDNWLRAGEMAEVTADDVVGYALIGAKNKTIYVDPTSTLANPQIVEFIYKPATMGSVRILTYYAGNESNVLDDYIVQVEIGSTFSITAPTYLGFTLASGENSKTITVDGSETIKFEYTDNRFTLTVETVVDGVTSTFSTESIVPDGKVHDIWPPYKTGYVAVQYSIDGAAPVAFGSTAIQVTADGDHKVTFMYKSIAEVVDEYVVSVTVRGVAVGSGAELYSYVTFRAKDSGAFTVDALGLSGYSLVGSGVYSGNVSDVDIVVTFEYESLATTVVVYAVDGAGVSVSGFTPIIVPAVIGQSFSYNAPYILGWNLVGDVTQSISNVTAADRELAFVYEKAVGNVLVVLKEGGSTGVVIKTISMDISVGGSLVVDVPDLSGDFYTAVSGQAAQTLNYSGSVQVVEFYYVKDVRSVVVETWDVTDVGSPFLIDVYSVGDYRVGEVASFVAPSESGYKLFGVTPQLVMVAAGSGDQVVRFEYVTLATNELVVEAVVDGVGTILYTYSLTGGVGSNITVPAPYLVGYVLAPGESASKSGVVPGTVVFRYVKNVVLVTVEVEDVYGGSLMPSVSYEVVKGLDHTVYAPHVPGYVLVSAGSVTYYSIGADQTATFVYELSQSVDIVTVTVNMVNTIGGSLVPSVSYEVVKGTDYTVYAPHVPGYELVNTTSSYTFLNISDNQTVAFVYRPHQPVIVTPTTVILSFDANGGSDAPYSLSVLVGTVINLRGIVAAAPEGMVFVGWATSPSGGVLVNEVLMNRDITIYAQYTNATGPQSAVVILSFDANGGSDAPYSLSVLVGTVINLRGIVAAAPEGMVFVGWATSPSGGVLVNEVFMDSDVTVYAQYVDQSTTVILSFDANGGSDAPYSLSVLVGTVINLRGIVAAAPEGMVFVGWATNQTSNDLINELLMNSDMTVYAQYTKAPSPSTTSRSSTTTSTPSSKTTPSTEPPIPSELPPTQPEEHPIPVEDKMWAVANGVFSILGIILVCVLIAWTLLHAKNKQTSQQNGTQRNAKQYNKRRNLAILIAFILSIVGIALFLLTQDFSLNMSLFDKWTIVHLVLIVAESICIWFAYKYKKPPC